MEKNFFRRMMDKLFGAGEVEKEKQMLKTQSSGAQIETSESPIEGSNSGWVSVDKNTSNIEKSKAAELGNYSSDQLLRMFEQIEDLVVFINKDLNIKYITPSIKDFLGYENKELVDKKFITLLAGNQFLDFQTAIEKLDRGRNKIQALFDFKTKASIVKQSEIFIKKFDDRKMGEGYLISSRAITDRTVDITIDEDEINALMQEKHDLEQALILSEANVKELQNKLVKMSESQPESDQFDQGKLSDVFEFCSKTMKNKIIKKTNMQFKNTLKITNKYKEETMKKMDLEEYFTDMYSLAILNMLSAMSLEKRLQLHYYLLNYNAYKNGRQDKNKILLSHVLEKILDDIGEVCRNLNFKFDIVGDQDVSIHANLEVFTNIIHNILLLIIEHDDGEKKDFKNYIRFEKYDQQVKINIVYFSEFKFDFIDVNYLEYVKQADVGSHEYIVNSISQLCKTQNIKIGYTEETDGVNSDNLSKQVLLVYDPDA